MYQCTKCKHTVEYTTNYCPLCGAETVQVEYVVVSAPAEPTPAPQTICQPSPEPQATYQPPQAEARPMYAYAQPEPQKKPHLAKKIVGMVLSIEGLVMNVIYFLYVFILSFMQEPEMTAFLAVFCTLFSVPLSIVGLAMSSSCRNAGDTSRMSKAGKVMGILGIILAALYIAIGCLGLTDIFYYGGYFY